MGIIYRNGTLTLELQADGSIDRREAGKLPSLDDIARERARKRYMVAIECSENSGNFEHAQALRDDMSDEFGGYHA